MNIGLDMMGGDFAPLEAVKGIKLFLGKREQGTGLPAGRQGTGNREQGQPDNHDNNDNIVLTLFGDKEQIQQLLDEHNVSQNNIRIVHTSQVIAMEEHPNQSD